MVVMAALNPRAVIHEKMMRKIHYILVRVLQEMAPAADIYM